MGDVKRYMHSDQRGAIEVHRGKYILFEDYITLKAERDALAAENLALKEFGDTLNDMHNNLNGEGTGIQGRAEVACQQVALEAALEEFDAIQTPATDAYANQLWAEGVEMFAKDFNCADISDDILEFAANLRKENGND